MTDPPSRRKAVTPDDVELIVRHAIAEYALDHGANATCAIANWCTCGRVDCAKTIQRILNHSKIAETRAHLVSEAMKP